jgi:hypothetical protein
MESWRRMISWSLIRGRSNSKEKGRGGELQEPGEEEMPGMQRISLTWMRVAGMQGKGLEEFLWSKASSTQCLAKVGG